jgi:hypothetical protein
MRRSHRDARAILGPLLGLLLASGCGGGGGAGTSGGGPPGKGGGGGGSGAGGGGPTSSNGGNGPSDGAPAGGGGRGGGPAGTGGSGGTAGPGGAGGTGSGAGGSAAGGGSAAPPPSGWVDEIPTPGDRLLGDGEVLMEPAGGTFVGNQAVKLSARAPGAVIHYTTDDTPPTTASPVYRQPINLQETTIVRALVAGGNPAPNPTAAAVYVRLADDLRGFTSNLPIVLLHSHKSGMLQLLAAPLVPGSVSVFEPAAGGRAALLGKATLTSRAGVRIRGNSSRAFPQRSYAFEARNPGSEEDQDRVVVRMPADSDWALVAPSYIDRSLVRTAVGFYLSNQAGQYAPRVRLVEAFLTETGGATGMKDYLGVFALTEKIKRGKQRVAVEKLDPVATTAPGVTGGYVFRIDHEQRDFMSGGYFFGFVYPDQDDLLMMPARMPQIAYLQGFLQELFDALARPDFKNPRTGKHYSAYIDVPSFVDNNLINALVKNVDAFRFSTYFSKNLGGPVKAGPLWDIDRSSGTPHDDFARTVDPREWARMDAANPLTYGWWARLFADPTFKAAHARRWAELSQGPWAVPQIHAIIDRFAAQVAEAEKRHFARWPIMAPEDGAHANEIRILKDWFAARVPWMSSQLSLP